jgi:hypothetical protein
LKIFGSDLTIAGEENMEPENHDICPKCGGVMVTLLPPAADGYHFAPGEGYPRCFKCEAEEEKRSNPKRV